MDSHNKVWTFASSVHLSEEIIVVSMEPEPAFKKMETVVKLDSVGFMFEFLHLLSKHIQ